MKVLIIEDEIMLGEAIGHLLKQSKYLYDIANDGETGLYYALNDDYDCIVLDIMLPKLDGFEVAKRIRKEGKNTSILMLTAKSDVADKIHGLNIGADDYLTKPFETEELIARIRALTRRQGTVVMDTLSFSDIVLDLKNYSLSCGEKTVGLGFKEFEIMRILLSNPKQVIEKETIISKVWGLDSEATDNNIEAYISFLRKKLFYLGSKVNIGVKRKLGYFLEAESC